MVEDTLYHSDRSIIRKIDMPGQTTVVWKEFSLRSANSDQEMLLHAELSGTTGVLHCFVCSYGDKPVMVTEFCGKGSIRTYFELMSEPISEEMLLQLYQSMQKTIISIHRKRVGHANIDATNWLLTDNMQVKLTDFGHSVRLPEANIESSIRHQFTHDSSQLACVFYQMATCDFRTDVLNVPETAVQLACAQRGYSRLVSDIICWLLLPLSTSSMIVNYCFCHRGIPAVREFYCEGSVCLPCEEMMRDPCILESSSRGSYVESPRSGSITAVSHYDFPSYTFTAALD